jgi:hypothetical protein
MFARLSHVIESGEDNSCDVCGAGFDLETDDLYLVGDDGCWALVCELCLDQMLLADRILCRECGHTLVSGSCAFGPEECLVCDHCGKGDVDDHCEDDHCEGSTHCVRCGRSFHPDAGEGGPFYATRHCPLCVSHFVALGVISALLRVVIEVDPKWFVGFTPAQLITIREADRCNPVSGLDGGDFIRYLIAHPDQVAVR